MRSFIELLGEMASFRDTKKADRTPEQHQKYEDSEEAGRKWHEEHPIHHMNVVAHYNMATPEEKEAGHSWYHEAHHINKAMAKDTGVHKSTMAGLISNYSPQTAWHTNIHTASRVARTKRALGGKGSGVFATKQQKTAAGRMLNGEHYDSVLAGHKTKAFAHLVEHGGTHPDEPHPKVVVDRHAYSVAAGARITDAAFGQAGLKGKKKYHQVAQTYHDAAKHISATTGKHVEPHQVQATTWLVRQRLNKAEESGSKTGGSKVAKAAAKAKALWHKYARKHHPSIAGNEPGTGY